MEQLKNNSKVIKNIFYLILMINLLCINVKSENNSFFSRELNRTIELIDPVYLNEEITISGEGIINIESEKIIKNSVENSSTKDNYLRYIFGLTPDISYNFIFGLTIWLIILSLFLLLNCKLIKKRIFSLVNSIVLTIILSNLKLNILLSNMLLKGIKSSIGRIIFIIIGITIINILVYYSLKKKKFLVI